MTAAGGTMLHASCISLSGRALLILGPSGAGKSALAMRLMALGAGLVADDRTELTLQGNAVLASCPPALSGLIEVRGLGILNHPPAGPAPVALVVDLGQQETERLPPRRATVILGVTLPLVLGLEGDHFPAALLCYLLHGRNA